MRVCETGRLVRVRFRYREYMGGPDPLAESDPAPEEAVTAARELLALVASSLRSTTAPDAEVVEASPLSREPSPPGGGEDSGEDRRELVTLEKVLSRYVSGDRDALGEVNTVAFGLLLDRLLGHGAGLLLARLDEADHGLSPRELRRLGEVALREVETARRGRGAHEGAHRGAGAPGDEATGGSVPWGEGDDRALDAIATVREATLRRLRPEERDVVLRAEDVRVTETEPAEAAAVSLLVDLSYSMVTRSLHEAATRTALALHTLVDTRRPEDRLHLVGFGERAQELSPPGVGLPRLATGSRHESAPRPASGACAHAPVQRSASAGAGGHRW